MAHAAILNRPRILLIGSNAPWALERFYARAFRQLGSPGSPGAGVEGVELFDVDPYKGLLHGASLAARALNKGASVASDWRSRRALLAFLRRTAGTFEVIVVFKGLEYSRADLESYRALHPSARWVNFYPDDPLDIGVRSNTNERVIESLSFYDLYCIWSHRLIPKLRERGCRRVEYLPFGYDPESHESPTLPLARSGCVVFAGQWDRHREAALAGLADLDLRIFGNHWDRVARDSPLRSKVAGARLIHGAELRRVISEGAVALNLTRAQNQDAHNMRTFEIPAMGGLMLTTRSKDQQAYFPEDEACLMFSDAEELRAKIEWVLSHPEQAARIRARGFELSKSHTYATRAARLLELVGSES